MRWLGRFNLKGPAQGARSLVSHDNCRIVIRRFPIRPSAASLPLRHGLGSSPGLRAKTSSSASPTLARLSDSGLSRHSNARGPRWPFLALVFTASAVMAYLYRWLAGAGDDDVINTSTFSAFTIVEREQVSPSAFIITLRPRGWVTPEALERGRGSEENGPSGFLSSRIQEAWRHGLWSVEIKQPQLQIARHYTPLPPLVTPVHSPSGEESSPARNGNVDGLQAIKNGNAAPKQETGEQDDLRILIRRMDGGEMSNYLARQRVGDTVWLRGPHLGFDVARRLGNLNDSSQDGDASIGEDGSHKGVVFLAGGTGIAPALQIAHRLLDGHNSSRGGRSKLRMSILWANRLGADALGREQFPPNRQSSNKWFGFWTRNGIDPSANPQEKGEHLNTEPISSLAAQIKDLKRRHRSHFEISYFVDDEGSFIRTSDLEAACSSILPSTRLGAKASSSPFASIDKGCSWHSAKAVELLPDNNDAARSSPGSAYACTCVPKAGAETALAHPGVNLLCVSGPDGFIEAYAGAKRWDEGNEMQGALRGLIGRMQKDNGEKISKWLVLKL